MFALPMPIIAPRADSSLWPSHRSTARPNEHDTPQHSPPTHPIQRRPNSPHTGQHYTRAQTSSAVLLSALSHDENTIERRKQNVRRFGAGWLRPPGVAKTLQAIRDEELEREEQELIQRRDQVLMDMTAAQQEAANAEARERGEQMEVEGGDGAGDDRDLDADVPEAEASESEMSTAAEEDEDRSEEEGSVEVSELERSGVPFNEDSFIEGSMVEAEVSHMLEMEEAEISGVLQDERDLDDDVPEAGSYEHTDSELEDDSTDGEIRLPPGFSVQSRRSRHSVGQRSTGRRSSGLPRGMPAADFSNIANNNLMGSRGLDLGADLGHGRSSFGIDGSSSILEGSSFLRSSPAATAARGSLRDRFLGASRGGRRA